MVRQLSSQKSISPGLFTNSDTHDIDWCEGKQLALKSKQGHWGVKSIRTTCDVDAMNDICSDMKEENELLQEKINTLEAKLEVAENQSRCSNLLFFGIPSTASKLWADCENKVVAKLLDFVIICLMLVTVLFEFMFML
ncbi:hypothetical protein ACOMHN_025538 [Nucella lapillus]